MPSCGYHASRVDTTLTTLTDGTGRVPDGTDGARDPLPIWDPVGNPGGFLMVTDTCAAERYTCVYLSPVLAGFMKLQDLLG